MTTTRDVAQLTIAIFAQPNVHCVLSCERMRCFHMCEGVFLLFDLLRQHLGAGSTQHKALADMCVNTTGAQPLYTAAKPAWPSVRSL